MKRWLVVLWTLPCLAAQRSDYFSVATGEFDIMRVKHRTWEFELEYKFIPSWLPPIIKDVEIRPLLGAMATMQKSGYLYGGFNLDLLFIPHVVISPGLAAGYYWRGGGKDLGYPLEFRSGVELAWEWDDTTRIGVHFYHLSNAGLGSRNPGEESFVFFYDIPITKNFPFKTK